MAKTRRRHRVAKPKSTLRARRTAGPRTASLGATERRRFDEPEHQLSGTAVATEALRTGVVRNAIRRNRNDEAIPGEARTIQAGDPDDETLGNAYVGDNTPGGSTPTPDQSNVDDIGRAYGLQDEDSGELRMSAEVMEGRDRRRRGAGLTRHRD